MNDRAGGCGILLHQRPLLQNLLQPDDPKKLELLIQWLAGPSSDITDASLKSATYRLDDHHLVFLKALVDDNPEIINVELPAGRFLTAAELEQAENVICVHTSNDPNSGFGLRYARDIRILGILNDLNLYSHRDPDKLAARAVADAGAT